MLACVECCTIIGIDALPVRVEVDVSPGLPGFEIVGLPSAAVRESRDRVRAAIRNAGYEFPLRRITVNLAPANLRKDGVGFDLAIAVGLLAASGQLDASTVAGWLVIGELSLDGSLAAVRGALAVGLLALKEGVKVLAPAANRREINLAPGVRFAVAETLAQVPEVLADDSSFTGSGPGADETGEFAGASPDEDLADIVGQARARRVLEIAAAGGHSMLLVGPPGAGKTMLARRLPGILPPLDPDEALVVTRIHSVAGQLPSDGELVSTRPFRAPHHSTTLAGMIGGGSNPKPGEISLAHAGVLFLDEFAEFSGNLRESLRQPLEDGCVTLARAGLTVTFPAEPTLVLATNPCPCGFTGDPETACRCTPRERWHYLQRLTGPILDRIDLRVEVGRLSSEELLGGGEREASREVRLRVRAARDKQKARSTRASLGERSPAYLNARLSARDTARLVRLDNDAKGLMAQAVRRFNLTGRGFSRALKVARTIADLAGDPDVKTQHLAEALQYRWSPDYESVGG